MQTLFKDKFLNLHINPLGRMGLQQIFNTCHSLHATRQGNDLGGPLLCNLLDALVVRGIDEHDLGLGDREQALDDGGLPAVVDGVEGRGIEKACSGDRDHISAGVGNDANLVLVVQALAFKKEGDPRGVGQHVGVSQHGAIVVGDLLLFK